jgi:hypothetical protein
MNRVRLPLFVLPEEYGSAKAATDPGERGCAKPMRRVSASDFDELFVESKKVSPPVLGLAGEGFAALPQ